MMASLKIVGLGFLLCGGALPALAAGGSDTTNVRSREDTADRAADQDPNRVICRREASTGSRLGAKRRCMTAAQWSDEQHEQRQQLERGQGIRPTSGG